MKEYHSQRSINHDKNSTNFDSSKKAHYCPSEKDKKGAKNSDSSFSEGDGGKKSENLSPMK